MSDSIVQNITFVLLAVLVGLSAGWLWWGRRASRLGEEAALLRDRVNELDPLPARIAEISQVQIAALAAKDKRMEEVQKQVDSEAANGVMKDGVIAQLRSHADEAASQAGELRLRLERGVNEARIALDTARTGWQARTDALSARLSELEPYVVELAEMEDRLPAVMAAKDSEISHLQTRLAQMEGVTALHAGQRTAAESAQSAAQTATGHFAGHEAKAETVPKSHDAKKDHEIAVLQSCVLDLQHGLRRIGDTLMQPPDPGAVSKAAYFHALARAFEGGPEREDWLQAENEVRLDTAASQWREISRRYH